jgi:capsular exopolysaccharide synthesis family protein
VQANSNHSVTQDQGDRIKTEILKYLKFWPFFLVGLVLAYIGAFLYLRYTPRVYQSKAKIQILNKNKGLELPSAAFIFNRSNINLENEIEILKSYDIIEKVVDTLNLTMRVYEEGNVLTTELYQLPFKVLKTRPNDSIKRAESYTIEVTETGFNIGRSGQNKFVNFPRHNTKSKAHNFPFELDGTQYNISEIVGKTYLIKLAPVWQVTRALKGKIGVSILGKTSDILVLTHTSQSKIRNERILNELIEVFNEDGKEDRREISKRSMEFISQRIDSLVIEIDSVETDIKTFKQNNDLIDIETNAELGISQKTAAEQELFDLENQLILLALLKDSIEQPDTESDLLPANIGISSGDVNNLVNAYNLLVLERNDLGVSAASNNPNIRIINKQLKDLKSNIIKSIKNYKNQLEATKQNLARKSSKFNAQVYALPLKEKLFKDITREQEIKQSLYLFLLQKYEEAAINKAITEDTVKTVEKALTGNSPISPKRNTIYSIALALGLGMPFGLIYLILLLDTKLKTRLDIEKISTKIPVVAEIPRIKKGNNLVFSNPNDHSIQAEAFRILSSNVDYLLPVNNEKEGKVIYCTSTIKGEGKTYVSLNLSLALSSLNKKVLLIGADLRNPQIHSYIQKDKYHIGLSNYLHEFDFDWKTALIHGFEQHPNHHILLSGSMPPNPAHLLTNGRFKALIEEAKSEYDYIVVDTAPTILVTDTMLISQLADATIYITRANFTEKKLLNYSKELYDTGKLKNMAYVVNSVGASKSYGYSYNYGYNYGYGSKS